MSKVSIILKRIMIRLRSLLYLFLISIFSLSTNVRSAEVIPLTVIDAYAPTALWVRVFMNYYLPEVDRRLAETGNYEIDWNRAFGGTVAKTGGVLEALQYGLADIGIITSPYHPDKIPFFNISYVTPLVTKDIGLAARTVDLLIEKYPEISDQTVEDYNQVFLTTAGVIDSYQVFMNQSIDSLDQFRGTKICGVGLNLRYVQGLGAAGVPAGLGDYYNNISTGLTEGTLAWAESAVAYKLYEVAPYMIDIGLGAVTSKIISMNKRSFDRVPEEVRLVLQEVATDYRDELAKETDRRAERSRHEFEEFGGTIVSLTDDQRIEWANSLPNMAKEWATDLEERGLPGNQILRDYMDIMRAEGQPIVRNWDQEL
ncbi:MAG: C4-dicarboxylate TRAP transporter substrate-binding protein [Pseudomonadota bacterium]|mgnify:FL=1|nr:C4-dicarboxylate TRAP transporter substrate-binding protein [Pseudomonadota bacterium]